MSSLGSGRQTTPIGHKEQRERRGQQMLARARIQGSQRAIQETPVFARRGTAVTDCGREPLAYAPPAAGSEFAPSGALMGCATSERPAIDSRRMAHVRRPGS